MTDYGKSKIALLEAEVRDLQERLTDTAQLWAASLDRITDLELKVKYLETRMEARIVY